MEKILIVDDESMVLSMLREVVSHEGYFVSTAKSGEQALDLLRQNVYDLVVSDITMPGISGLELLECVRENWPEIKVIIITGQGSIETKATAFNLGAEDFLDKPFHFDDLLKRIKDVLSRKALESEAHRFKALASHLVEENRRLREQMEQMQGESAAI